MDIWFYSSVLQACLSFRCKHFGLTLSLAAELSEVIPLVSLCL